MIPLFAPQLGEGERRAAERVLQRGVLSRGPEVQAFEEEFAAYAGRRHAVAVSSGTAALHVAVAALRWGPQDTVLTAALGYIATANALLFDGARPAFVDADETTLGMDLRGVEPDLARRCRGVIVTHLLGLPVDPEAARRLRDERGLEVIEDASQAVGPSSAGFPVGAYGRLAAYSFHENKPLTTGGEGGILTTDDAALADECRALRDQGRRTGRDWLLHVGVGYNYRLTELQAAIGRAQLQALPSMLARRRELAEHYTGLLRDEPGVAPMTDPRGRERSWFMYFVRFADTESLARAERALAAAEIETRRLSPPIPRFPAHRRFSDHSYDRAETIVAHHLAVPLHAGLADSDVATVVDVLRTALSGAPAAARHARV